MRDAIEDSYRAVLHQRGAEFPADIPEGVTPQTWHYAIKPDQFDPAELAIAASRLSDTGFGLGLNAFARLEVEDRPPAQAKSHARTHRRDRAYIVRAFGWRK